MPGCFRLRYLASSSGLVFGRAVSLPSFPLRVSWGGPVLLVSLFDGVGCVPLTLAALGAQFCLISVKLSADSGSGLFQPALNFPVAEQFDPAALPAEWRAAPFWMILVVGQLPNVSCEQPSSTRASACSHVKRAGLTCSCVWPQSSVWCVLESRCPLSDGERSKNSESLPMGPVRTCAADWGHLGHESLWWLWSAGPAVLRVDPMPLLDVETGSQEVLLKYTGKPWPKKCFSRKGLICVIPPRSAECR